ncbi:MAG TPA: ABC transporter permease [Nocardioidaceae bacterium]|nr:ABC transporter permease [Nocardioidaceae bacterium]
MTEQTMEGVSTPPASGDPSQQSGGSSTRSLWGDALHDLIRNPLFVIPVLVVLAVVSMAIAPQIWTGADPNNCHLVQSKHGPSPGHPFGFTIYGCDMFAQVIYGARPDIIIAVVCTAGIATVGTALGTLAGFFGGWTDIIISRLTDIFFGLPFILAALIFLAIVGNHSVYAVSLILIVFGWTQLTRIMRGSVLETKNRDYVEAARALGARNGRIIFKHILPNAIAPVIVLSTIALGGFVSAEATLTFLGVGLQRPTISWGVLITDGQDWAISGYPHLLVYPCAFLIATVLAFILVGDAVRDALDPKLR